MEIVLFFYGEHMTFQCKLCQYVITMYTLERLVGSAYFYLISVN